MLVPDLGHHRDLTAARVRVGAVVGIDSVRLRVVPLFVDVRDVLAGQVLLVLVDTRATRDSRDRVTMTMIVAMLSPDAALSDARRTRLRGIPRAIAPRAKLPAHLEAGPGG